MTEGPRPRPIVRQENHILRCRRRLHSIGRAWRAAGRLADAAEVVLGQDATQELLRLVRLPLRRAARQEASLLRLSQPSDPMKKEN